MLGTQAGQFYLSAAEVTLRARADGYLGALASEGQRYRSSDAPAGAAHNGDPIFKA
jgi:hypothetical protein